MDRMETPGESSGGLRVVRGERGTKGEEHAMREAGGEGYIGPVAGDPRLGPAQGRGINGRLCVTGTAWDRDRTRWGAERGKRTVLASQGDCKKFTHLVVVPLSRINDCDVSISE